MGSHYVWCIALSASCYVPTHRCWRILTVVYTGDMTILLMHIAIALLSVAVATLAFFKPSTKVFYTSYGFIVATVATGTLLIFTNSVDIVRSCLSGLFYVTVLSLMTSAAHVRARNAAGAPVNMK